MIGSEMIQSLKLFVQILREDIAVFPWTRTKKYVVWLLLLAICWACGRLTWEWSWQMEKAEPRELQRNGSIFLIIPGLKSSLPMDLSVKWANKLHLLFKPVWVGFYIAWAWKHYKLYLLLSLFREGMSALFCYMWKLIFRISLERRVYVDLGQPKEWTLLAT